MKTTYSQNKSEMSDSTKNAERNWIDESQFRIEQNKMTVVDCGKNYATVYDGTGKEKASRITLNELLALPKNPKYKGHFLVGENAHLGVATNASSLSQPFTEEQLRKFYEDCENNDIILRFFPQQSTPKAATYAGLEKSDENDPVSIYKFIKDRLRNVSLRLPNSSFETTKVRTEGYTFKGNVTNVENHARRYGYQDALSKFIIKNLDYLSSAFSEEAKDVFRLTEDSKYKVGDRKDQFNVSKVKLVLLHPLLAILKGKIVKDDSGKFVLSENLNIREGTNKLPSWNFSKKYVLNFSPNHLKGGVARSNLMYHGERFFISRKMAEDGIVEKGAEARKIRVGEMFANENLEKHREAFSKYRKQYRDALREAFNVFRQILAGDNTELL